MEGEREKEREIKSLREGSIGRRNIEKGVRGRGRRGRGKGEERLVSLSR